MKATIFNKLRFRNNALQIILVLSVIILFVFLINNASNNLVKQGIASGFDFLHQTTGFDIASSLIHYDSSSTYLRLFVVALLNTLLVSLVSIIAATFIGFIIAFMRISKHPIASRIAMAYVELFRNIPLLLQVFFWYFAVLQPLPSPRQSLAFFNSIFLNNRGLHIPAPLFSGHALWFFISLIVAIAALMYVYRRAKQYRIVQGYNYSKQWWFYRMSLLLVFVILSFFYTNIDLSWNLPRLQGFNFTGGAILTPEFFALFLALSTYTGAYIAENVRSGIQSVEKGQIEAAQAIGLSPFAIIRFVIIPNAMRVIIPPLTNQYLTLTKNSSLAAAIAYPDIVLVFAGTALNQTGQAVEILLMVMLVYLSISLVIAFLMNLYNRSMALKER